MTATVKKSPAMNIQRVLHQNVQSDAFHKTAGAVDNADTRAAYQAGYIAALEADRQADGAGNIN